MTAFMSKPPAGLATRPAGDRRVKPRRGGTVPGLILPPAGPGTIPLHITYTCIKGCGVIASGLTSDPPTTPRPTGWKHGRAEKGWTGGVEAWTRWAEMEREAAAHPHLATMDAEPTAAPAAAGGTG